MRLMNEVLSPCIGHFVVVCFDDILVYSRSKKEHVSDLKQVLEVLRKQKLHAKLEKCQSFSSSFILGYAVSKAGISNDQSKVEALKTWPIS